MASALRAASKKAEAEKILNKKTIFGSVFGFGKDEKYENAAELYKKAGNEYKMAKDYQSSGEMYENAANCYSSVDIGQMDQYRCLVDAANVYKQGKLLEKAISIFQKIIDYYNESGKYGQSAKMNKEVAELLENDDPEGAIAFYETAADLFNNDSPPKRSNGNQCMLQVAQIVSEKLEDYKKAANVFEQLAMDSMETKLGAYAAKGHFFNSLLCHMATFDNVNAQIKMTQYQEKDYTFGSSRECQLITKLLASCEGMDEDGFSSECSLYDRISPISPWMTSLLLRIKRHNFASSSDIGGNSGSGGGDDNGIGEEAEDAVDLT